MLERTEEAAPPTTEFRLRALERELRISLPQDYRAFLLEHNGGRPVPAGFVVPFEPEPAPWRVHFFLGVDNPVNSSSLRWCAEVTAATRPLGTIPIATDEFGQSPFPSLV
jgi:hypothetical protein